MCPTTTATAAHRAPPHSNNSSNRAQDTILQPATINPVMPVAHRVRQICNDSPRSPLVEATTLQTILTAMHARMHRLAIIICRNKEVGHRAEAPHHARAVLPTIVAAIITCKQVVCKTLVPPQPLRVVIMVTAAVEVLVVTPTPTIPHRRHSSSNNNNQVAINHRCRQVQLAI